jgi:hypothetical protein
MLWFYESFFPEVWIFFVSTGRSKPAPMREEAPIEHLHICMKTTVLTGDCCVEPYVNPDQDETP